MASADEGDASRLRIGGWVPESEDEPGDGSLESAVTQLIPVVRDDDGPRVPGGRVGSDPVQRAIARRAPAPLPDLGRRDAPAEPRRRKSAVGATVAHAPAEEPDGAAAARDDAVLPRALPTRAEPRDGDLREDAPTQADPAASAPGDVVRRPPPEGSAGPGAHPGPAARPGPTVLPADNWDYTHPETGSTDEPHQLRRRAVAPAGRLWALITLVLVGLGAAIAIPLATISSPRGGDPLTLAAPATSLAPGDHPVPGTEGSAAATASPAPSLAPRSPSPSSIRTQQGTVANAPSQAPGHSPPAPSFVPATFEAEADGNELGGSARRWKGIVRNIGDWGLDNGDGWLRFTNLTMPSAGTYTLTVYYTFMNGETSRSALITVNGADAFGTDFAGPAPCCDTSVQVPVMLQVGANTIHFANPDGHAPSIDKIVISGP